MSQPSYPGPDELINETTAELPALSILDDGARAWQCRPARGDAGEHWFPAAAHLPPLTWADLVAVSLISGDGLGISVVRVGPRPTPPRSESSR